RVLFRSAAPSRVVHVLLQVSAWSPRLVPIHPVPGDKITTFPGIARYRFVMNARDALGGASPVRAGGRQVEAAGGWSGDAGRAAARPEPNPPEARCWGRRGSRAVPGRSRRGARP